MIAATMGVITQDFDHSALANTVVGTLIYHAFQFFAQRI